MKLLNFGDLGPDTSEQAGERFCKRLIALKIVLMINPTEQK